MDSFLFGAMSVEDLLGNISTIAKTAAGLGFVIFIHELGHFLAAKACGVKCEKFYVGFDPPISIFGIALPRTLGKFQWGETEYGIGIIPLGGYVKMLGQDDDPRLASQRAELERIRQEQGESDGEGSDTIENDADSNSESEAAPLQLDPRSYPAKTVPQRMLIISAGVLMNLISAVFLAAAAYGLGVSFLPCEFSSATPGDPAWTAGIEPGDKLVQIGREGEPDEHLRFRWELRQRVAHAGIRGDNKPMELLIRKRNGDLVWHTILPSQRMNAIRRFATLGVLAPRSSRLNKVPVWLDSAADKAEPPLQGGDLIVGVDGQSLEQTSLNEEGELRNEQIESILFANRSKPVTLTIERKQEGDSEPKRLQVVVPPAYRRDTGLRMAMGPIVGLRKDSPAEKAGLQVGDMIETINGDKVDNAITLPLRYGYLNEPLVLTVRRGAGEAAKAIEITIAPDSNPTRQLPEVAAIGAFLSLENVGLAYSVRQDVAAVAPGSPAEKAGMLPGDTLLKGRYICDDESLVKEMRESGILLSMEDFDIKPNEANWASVDSILQDLPQEVKLELTYERNGAMGKATVETVQEKDLFASRRGLNYDSFQRVHVAEGVGDAMSLGYRETSEKFTEVLSFLGLLFSGKISPTDLGGPIRIAAVAGNEASVSIARLLLFLTFLSCNLAIVNFLPIPALDGGHMVFLIWEGVTGRPPNENVQMTATLIGVVFLLTVMVFVLGNDVWQSLQ